MSTNSINSEKKGFAIVFMADRSYTFSIGAILVNLKKTNNHLIDGIVIYHSDLSKDDCSKLAKIDPRVSFVQYTYEMFSNEHGKIFKENGKHFVNRYSHLSLARYKILEQLLYYQKILYLDLDMLIRGDISELLNISGFAWRNDALLSFRGKFEKFMGIESFCKTYNVDAECTSKWQAPNAGLIYASSDCVDSHTALVLGREFISKYMNDYRAHIDEMAFSFIANYLKIPITALDRTIYNTLPIWYVHDSKVMHFMSHNKVWNNNILQTVFPEWMDYYNEAQQISSFDTDKVIKYDTPTLKNSLCEALWQNLLNHYDFCNIKNFRTNYTFTEPKIHIRYSSDVYYVFILNVMFRSYRFELHISNLSLINNKQFLDDLKSICDGEKILLTHNATNNDVIIRNKERYCENFVADFCTLHIPFAEMLFVYRRNDVNKTIDGVVKKDYIERLQSLQNNRVAINLNLHSKKLITDVFNIINNEDKYICILSAKDDCSKHWKEFVKKSGIPTEIEPLFRNAYILVYSKERVFYEKSSCDGVIVWNQIIDLDQGISEFSNNGDAIVKQVFITVESEGYRYGKESSRILVNNTDYSLNHRGVNCVVIDTYEGTIHDSFAIDLWKEDYKYVLR